MTRHATHEPRPPIDFDPVPRRGRLDGWTPHRQREFIATLSLTGSLTAAATSVNMSMGGAIALRKEPGAESFRQAWDAAIATASERIRDVLVDHALNGVPDPVFFGGKQVGERRRYNLRGQQYILEKGDRARERIESRDDDAQRTDARDSVMARMQAFLDDERRRLLAKIDDEDKKRAFNLLWGSPHGYPWAPGSAPTAEAFAAVDVANAVVGGAAAMEALARES